MTGLAGHGRRLLTTGLAYQFSDVVAKGIALVLLPVYTRHLTRADYGTAEVLVTLVILVSILARLGLGEALVRFHYLDADPERRRRVARTASGVLLAVTTTGAVAVALAAEPVSRLVLGTEQPDVIRAAALGLWGFTNLELLYGLLRAEGRPRAYLTASLVNVGLTVALTLVLVVGLDQGALGLLVGNYAATVVVVLGLGFAMREALGLRPARVDRAQLGAMLRFGLPTVPADLAIFALFLVDRIWLYRVDSEDAAGLYSLSVKLAGAVIFTVRAFQLAWPPLAYSVEDDAEAGRLYARITTWYVVVTALVVAALTLLGRWVVRLLAAPAFFAAHEALPWVALGWALYGLYFVLAAMAGRARVTIRTVPAALAALAVNAALLAALVGPLGIAGAGIALVGAYLVMLVVAYALARSVFPVPFEWGRLALVVAVAGGLAVTGELLLPTSGAAGLLSRALVAALIPVVLVAAGFLRPGERALLLARVSRLALCG